MTKAYHSEPLSFNRKMVAASAAVTAGKSTIHSLAQVDVTEPRRIIKDHFKRTGIKLSFTAYIVYCLSQVLKDHPQLNAFRRRNSIITLEDLTISVLVEREFMGEKVPEPLSLKTTQELTYREIMEKIRAAQSGSSSPIGALSGASWIRFIPGFLLKTFVRIADHNLKLAQKYGKVAVTAVGMFSSEPIWFIPHGSGTVLITVGSIEKRTISDGSQQEEREYLCLTGSFDHEIVDGAPAARFMNQFLETIKSGMPLRSFLSDQENKVPESGLTD